MRRSLSDVTTTRQAARRAVERWRRDKRKVNPMLALFVIRSLGARHPLVLSFFQGESQLLHYAARRGLPENDSDLFSRFGCIPEI